MNRSKRPRSENNDRDLDVDRQCKHLRIAKPADDPTIQDLHEDTPLYTSIQKWLQNVQISENPDPDMADLNPVADLQEVIMIEQLEASFTIQETSPLERPGSPTKRKLDTASQSGYSPVSNRDLSTRIFAEPVSRFNVTKQVRSRNSSPEKQSTRSRSRNSSPEKQSASVRTTISSTTIPLRRLAMAKCSPGFLFCHKHRVSSGIIPKAVLDFKKRTSPSMLLKGCLPSSQRDDLIERFPDDDFCPSFFSNSPKHGQNLVDYVTTNYEDGILNFYSDATESSFSDMAKTLLGGLKNEKREPLQVAGIENITLQTGVLPPNMPSLRSDIIIQANPRYPSKFADLCRQIALPPVEIDESFSPFAHPSFRFSPAFAVAEVKSCGGNLQEAQMQAAVVGGAILLKARHIGASVEEVPFVPAIVVFGSTWYLHLIYEEAKYIIISGPWTLGDTVTFVGTLRIVLFIEEMRAYAQDTWLKHFVDGYCSEVLESTLEEPNLEEE
ncbi:hypothetical protein TWF281_004920 [Arthrobotrys megalospora]